MYAKGISFMTKGNYRYDLSPCLRVAAACLLTYTHVVCHRDLLKPGVLHMHNRAIYTRKNKTRLT